MVKMSGPRKKLVCKSCQLAFPTYEDLDLHSCLVIKQESQECDQDLSEEFLSTIIQYVDDLCNIIRNGDSLADGVSTLNEYALVFSTRAFIQLRMMQ